MTAAAYRLVATRGWDPLRLALALALLTFVWRVQDLFGPLGALRLLSVATVAVCVVVLLDADAKRQLAVVLRHPLGRLSMLFVVLGAVSIPGSLWPGASFDFVLKNLLPSIALALLVACGIREVGDARRLTGVVVAGAALYAVVILTRFDIGPGGRLGDLVSYDANDLGMLLACSLPLAIFFVRHARWLATRMAASATVVLFILTIVKTGSRGAFLGLLAVCLYLLVRFKSVSMRSRALVVGSLALLLVLSGSSGYWKSMSTLMTPTTDYNWVGKEEGGRMNVWKRGMGYMVDRPLTGVGIGAFPIAEGTISPLAGRQSFGKGLKWSAAHNSFVQAGAELGVGGLLAFIGILFLSWRTANRLSRDARATPGVDVTVAPLADTYGAVIVGYAVSGFFLSQAYGPFLYVVAGTVIGLDIAARRA